MVTFGITWDLSQVESCSWGSLVTKGVFRAVFPTADLDEVDFLLILPTRPCVLVDGIGTRRRAQLLGWSLALEFQNPQTKQEE